MARPRKDGLDYFPHDTDAHLDDEKLGPYRALHGLAGIGFFWEMVERIYRTAAGELKMSTDYRRMTCQRMNITAKQFSKLQADALRLGLFSRKDYKERGMLTSSGIKKRFNVVQRKREQNRLVSVAETDKNTATTPERKEGIKNTKKHEKENSETSTTSRPRDLISKDKAKQAWDYIRPMLRAYVNNRTPLAIRDDLALSTFHNLQSKVETSELWDMFKNSEDAFGVAFMNQAEKIEIENL